MTHCHQRAQPHRGDAFAELLKGQGDTNPIQPVRIRELTQAARQVVELYEGGIINAKPGACRRAIATLKKSLERLEQPDAAQRNGPTWSGEWNRRERR